MSSYFSGPSAGDPIALLANGSRYVYDKIPVEFESQSVTVRGLLFVPRGLRKRVPAVTITGPILFVKEQAPLQYATRLASRGLVALIYDHRNHGESDGEPRRYRSPSPSQASQESAVHWRWESGQLKREDIAASLDFLERRPEVDPERMIMLGVCMGATWGLQAAADDPRIKALGTVAGFYVNRGDWELMFGSAEAFEERVEKGNDARRRFRQSRGRDVDYLPIVDQHRQDVLLPKMQRLSQTSFEEYIWGWYAGWPYHSRWENRYAVMSNVELLGTDVGPAARRLAKPWLLVHSDNSNNPDNARSVFRSAPSGTKEVQWQGETIHTDFYDQPDVIDEAVAGLYSYWRRQLRF